MNRGKPNALLTELVVVLLFFSLSASIILQLFVAAHDKSIRGTVDSVATLIAEDVADRFAVSKLDTRAFFEAEGYAAQGEKHVGEVGIGTGERKLRLEAETVAEAGVAGSLEQGMLTVFDGDLAVVALPISRYLPKEAVE